MNKALVKELRRIVGDEGIITDHGRRFAFASDGLTVLREVPELVLLPRDTQQTAACMKLLHAERVPIVPRGAGTGLSGGATPTPGGALIGTARMRDVLELCPIDRLARVQAGIVNIDLTNCSAPHGLFYAPDPSSQMACTIGGNVAENSGGPHCFKYGSTTRHVLGLVIVTHDGEILDLSEPEPDPAGYDLVGLFVGSEGMFGIATEVTIALSPMPEVTETSLALFADLGAACDAVSDIIAARLEPSALEILDKLTIDAVEASVYAAGYPREVEAVLLIEVEGTEVEVASTSSAILSLLEGQNVLEVRQARDSDERKQLWAGRKGAFGAMGRIAPDLYVADVVVPRTKLRWLVERATEVCQEKGLRLANVFHAGDGNLHPNISYDRRNEDELRRVLEAGDAIMQACIDAGGSLTGEHGVGLEKKKSMDLVFSPDDLCWMDQVRSVWDPDRRLNPGKVIPEHACLETRTRSPYAPQRFGTGEVAP